MFTREEILFINYFGKIISTGIMAFGWWNDWRGHTQIIGSMGIAFFMGMTVAMWVIKH